MLIKIGQIEKVFLEGDIKMDEKITVLLNIINEILEDKDKKTLSQINEGTSLRKDAGMDSIDLAGLAARIDEEYDVYIFEGGIIDTVGEVLKKLG